MLKSSMNHCRWGSLGWLNPDSWLINRYHSLYSNDLQVSLCESVTQFTSSKAVQLFSVLGFVDNYHSVNYHNRTDYIVNPFCMLTEKRGTRYSTTERGSGQFGAHIYMPTRWPLSLHSLLLRTWNLSGFANSFLFMLVRSLLTAFRGLHHIFKMPQAILADSIPYLLWKPRLTSSWKLLAL